MSEECNISLYLGSSKLTAISIGLVLRKICDNAVHTRRQNRVTSHLCVFSLKLSTCDLVRLLYWKSGLQLRLTDWSWIDHILFLLFYDRQIIFSSLVSESWWFNHRFIHSWWKILYSSPKMYSLKSLQRKPTYESEKSLQGFKRVLVYVIIKAHFTHRFSSDGKEDRSIDVDGLDYISFLTISIENHPVPTSRIRAQHLLLTCEKCAESNMARKLYK